MKRITRLFVILGLSCLTPAMTQDVKSSSQVTLPWQEFKDMLHLDDQNMTISVETFQKLLEQTGSQTKPPYTLKNGNVILTRTAFDELVSRMKPPRNADETPPFEYLITQGAYAGRMQKESARFTAGFRVHVLKQEGFTTIPLLPQNLALESMKVNGRPALVVSQHGYHSVLIKESGVFEIEAEFSVQASLEKGPHRIDLQIQSTPITLLELEIPLLNIDVEIPQSQQMSTRMLNGKTIIRSVLASGNQISIRWRKQLAVTEKVPSKLYAEVQHLISIEDDALKTSSEILLNILHSEIEEVRILIPEDLNILSVTGEGVGEWQETSRQSQRILNIPFTYSKKGNIALTVVSEAPFSDGVLTTQFEGFQLPDAVRETGFLGVELNTSAEVNVAELHNVEKIPIQKLPPRMINKSVKPMILGFKYLKHPFHIMLSIEKHEKIAVPAAVIESANAVTLFTEDGKIVHRLVYQVRNSAKQFLEITLPETSDVWSVFVGDQPVESSMNAEGALLIPLNRSQTYDNQLSTFPVEIILCAVRKPFAPVQDLNVQLPQADILTSQIIWSVYLPYGYRYLNFRSTLEKEEIIRGLNLFQMSKRALDSEARQKYETGLEEMPHEALNDIYKGKESKSRFRNVPMDEDQMMGQMEQELDFSDRLDAISRQSVPGTAGGAMTTGVLPIQIKIPTSGQVYRFAKTIIKADDSLQIQVLSVRQWISGAFRWLLIAAVVLILILLRNAVSRLLQWIMTGWKWLSRIFKKYKKQLILLGQSRLLPFALFGLAVLFFDVFRVLSLVFFFAVFLVAVDRMIKFFDKKRKKKKR